MKRFLTTALTAGLLLMAFTAGAAEAKIGIIDLRKVFDDYFKTKAADVFLKDKAGKLEKERKGLLDTYQKSTEDYKKSLDDANNQAISADEREKRKKGAEGKLLEIKEMENTITQFDRSARSQLDEEQRQAREKILDEIKATILRKSKANSFSLVIDSAAESVNKTPIVLFTDGSNDITADVLKELNATAPPEAALELVPSKPNGLKAK